MSTTDDTGSSNTCLFTPAQTAKRLRVSPDTLAYWRSTGRHNLPFIKIGGGMVRYREADLNAWLNARVRTGKYNTSGLICDKTYTGLPEFQAIKNPAFARRAN